MCVRCGTGRIAWCTDPDRRGDGPEMPEASARQPARTCCGRPMQTLDVFGVRLHQCVHRSHHPLVFRNLNTGEELTETYDAGDGGLQWAQHYPPGSDEERN